MGPTRKVPRLNFSSTANLHQARGAAGTVVTVRDISTLGCQLEHAPAPKIGKTCELYFDWQGTSVGIEAKVVWNARGRVGLKYERIDDHSQRCLRELCASLQSQKPGGRRGGDAVAAGALPDSTRNLDAEHPMFRPVVSPPPAKTDSETSRRTLPRYISELRGDVLNAATGKSANVFLVDLSVTGARLEGTGLPDAGQPCQLHTEWEGRHMTLPGQVAWKTSKQVGVKFALLDDESVRQLRQICASLLIAPSGPRA